MVAAYRTAEVVVCPRRFEGFGLTPVEATACAAPVVVSDIPPHREFLGTAPHFFTLDDDASVLRAIAAARSRPPRSGDILDGLTIEAAADRFFAALAPHLGSGG
jgi:glycosyltransferase involved in cell wall biosynthesis